MSARLLAAATLLLGGCAAATAPQAALTPAPTGPDPVVAGIVARAASQVRPCYRSPRVPRAARQIITMLGVAYTMDGQIAAQPVVVRQIGITPETEPYADDMAQAAIVAVMRCAPLKLPSEYYSGGWDEFVLTFSPKGLA